MPYTELYDYDKCARFVAQFIAYEPLDLPTSLPAILPSPATVMDWQAGDSFDCAQLLCSLLLGVGYDAYVVSGYAPKAVALADQSSVILPALRPAPAAPPAESPPPKKYAVRPRKALSSNFLKQREAEIAAAAHGDSTAIAPKGQGQSEPALPAAAEDHQVDELQGRRVHAWVLVLAGKRMLEASLFLEPTTGSSYSLSSAPYRTIESVWNTSNYWVNLQGPLPPAELSYDLAAPAKWEGLLAESESELVDDNDDDPTLAAAELAAGRAGTPGAEPPQKVGVEAGASALAADRTRMDMPPAWSARIRLDRERLQARCPAAQRLTTYHTAHLEQFPPYSREDGLVERMTIFSDIEMEDAYEVRESYRNRKDKLSSRTVNQREGRTVETFEPGRSRALRELVSIEGSRREFRYYDGARLDGLMSRTEVFGDKTTLTYSGDGSTLTQRTASYAEASPGSGPTVRKMTERYRRTDEVDAEADVAKRTFDLANGVIKVRYHFGQDRVTRSWRTYSKQGHRVVQVDPFSRTPTDTELQEEYAQLQQAERESLTQLRETDRQAKDELTRRADEEAVIAEAMDEDEQVFGDGNFALPRHLSVSAYDTGRSKLVLSHDETEEVAEVPRDFLTPFLPRQLSPEAPPLTREEALRVRDDCLRSLKDRLVERATIVQSRLDEENAALSKRQTTFQRNRDHMDPREEEEYEAFCQEAMFRIQILEQRLERHTELSLHKYAELDTRLRSDLRLAALAG